MLEKDDFRKECFALKRHIKRTVSQLQPKHEVVLEKVCPSIFTRSNC